MESDNEPKIYNGILITRSANRARPPREGLASVGLWNVRGLGTRLRRCHNKGRSLIPRSKASVFGESLTLRHRRAIRCSGDWESLWARDLHA